MRMIPTVFHMEKVENYQPFSIVLSLTLPGPCAKINTLLTSMEGYNRTEQVFKAK